jgi:hypothetical protein
VVQLAGRLALLLLVRLRLLVAVVVEQQVRLLEALRELFLAGMVVVTAVLAGTLPLELTVVVVEGLAVTLVMAALVERLGQAVHRGLVVAVVEVQVVVLLTLLVVVVVQGFMEKELVAEVVSLQRVTVLAVLAVLTGQDF